MKDGNVVVGNVVTIKDKVKYYDQIKVKAGKNSLIDLEVGAFSRPLTSSEKRLTVYRNCYKCLSMLKFFQGKY